MNRKKKNIVKVIMGVIVIIAMLAVGYGVFYRPLIRYVDTHTWATVRTVESVNSETSDVFVGTIEYVKGDKIYFYSAVLLIEDITTDGVVTFSVCDGALYDKNNEQVKQFVLKCGESCSYREQLGHVTIGVVSKRFQ